MPCRSPIAATSASPSPAPVCANGVMIVTDAKNGHQVAKLTIGKRPDAVAWDAARKLVLSSNGEGTLSVVQQLDADHYEAASTVATLKAPARWRSIRTATRYFWSVRRRWRKARRWKVSRCWWWLGNNRDGSAGPTPGVAAATLSGGATSRRT
jgi:hypothetical protein